MISLIFMFLAGCMNGMMDRISFHWAKAPEWMKNNERFWRVIPEKLLKPEIKNTIVKTDLLGAMDLIIRDIETLQDFDNVKGSLWTNKYKNDDPSQGPKFWGSTTFFVAFTDGWHLLKLIMKIMLVLSIVSYAGASGIYFETPAIRLVLDPVLLYLAWQGGFKLTYK